MSAEFVGASSQSLNLASPVLTAAPFTIGLWCRASATGEHVAVLSNTTSSTMWVSLEVASATQWDLGTNADDAFVNGFTANAWTFIVIRYISGTNRRIATLTAAGTIAHAQGTTSQTLSGINQLRLGGFQSSASNTSDLNGNVAEFWYTKTDIQADGAQLNDNLFRQLAYYGPFSVPYIGASVVEYRPFLQSRGSDTEITGEVYYGASGRQVWINQNSVSVGEHPPLPGAYVRPGDRAGIMPF
jgi:hypothetical protein